MKLDALIPVLVTMTRRATELSPDNKTLTGWMTHSRRLELTNEADGTTSVWSRGELMIAGRVEETAVLVGTLCDEARLGRVHQKAKGLLAEVITNGSRAAVLLGKCQTSGGQRVFVYHASDFDPASAATRFASFVDRHRLIVEGSDTKPVNKPVAKSKTKAAAPAVA
jgi:hypothetical protein